MVDDENLEEDKIYLSNLNGKIAYSMIATFGTPVKNKLTDIEAPEEFTLQSLNKLKHEIIRFAFGQGHLEISAIIIILKKTNGARYYDPLSDFQGMTEQDLINLNSGWPAV